MLCSDWNSRPSFDVKNSKVWFTSLTEAFNDSSAERFTEDDNLDTGNAAPESEPFKPFVDSILNAFFSNQDTHRKYTQLNAHSKQRDSLATSARCAFSALGIRQDDQPLFSCLSYGATQAWEACCRLIVQHPGDVILVPTPTYTLLVPPVMLAGGDVRYIHLAPSAVLTPELLREACYDESTTLWRQWRRGLSRRLENFAAACEAALSLPDGELAGRLPSHLDTLFEGVEEILNVRRRDTYIATCLLEIFRFNKSETDVLKERGLIGKHVAPPRVAGLLFINPTLGGRYYRQNEVDELAHVIQEYDLFVVEDLAYTLLPLNTAILPAMGRFACSPASSRLSVTILGLSKPLSVANHRVGVLLSTDKGVIDSVDGYIKASVAQVATYLYDAVCESLSSTDTLVDYIKGNASNPTFGYRRKLRVALGCLRGSSDSRHATEILQSLVGGGISPSDPLAHEFCKRGLQDYLSVMCEPEGGIFIFVDAHRAICKLQELGFRVRCSYELSIFLAYALRVRTIPEEVTRSWDAYTKPASLLRISFSVSSGTFCRALFELYKFFAGAKTPCHPLESRRPLTFAEQAMFVEQMQRSKAYTVVSPVRISGKIDLSQLQNAVNIVVSENPSLTFTYPFSDDDAPCCVAAAPPLPVLCVDASVSNIASFVEQPFDVSSGAPLSALRLFRVSETEHVLILVQHHIVTDNTSIGIIMQRLFELYGDSAASSVELTHVVDALPGLLWTNEADIDWHVTALADLEEPFVVSNDTTFAECDEATLPVSDELHRSLLSACPDCTEFEILVAVCGMALQAVFPLCTSFGVLLPATVRRRREDLGVTGFAVNALVCRLDVGWNKSFQQVVHAAANAIRDCREHSAAPLPLVAKRLRGKRNYSLGDIAVVVRPPPGAPATKAVNGSQLTWGHKRLDAVRRDGTLFGTCKHPITITLSRRDATSFGLDVDLTVARGVPAGTLESLQRALDQVFSKCSDLTTMVSHIGTSFDPFFGLYNSQIFCAHRVFKLAAMHPAGRALVSPDTSQTISFPDLLSKALHVTALISERQWSAVRIALPSGVARIAVTLGALASGTTLVLGSTHGDTSDTGVFVREENAVFAASTVSVRRDGSLACAAPSFPRRIADRLASLHPDGVAVRVCSSESTFELTNIALRVQLDVWQTVLQQSSASPQGRVFSTCALADSMQYFAETIGALLIGFQVCLGGKGSVPVNYAPTTIFVQGVDAMRVLLSPSSLPVVWGPCNSDALSALRGSHNNQIIPVALPSPVGVFASLSWCNSYADGVPIGRPAPRTHLLLQRRDGSEVRVAGEVGDVVLVADGQRITLGVMARLVMGRLVFSSDVVSARTSRISNEKPELATRNESAESKVIEAFAQLLNVPSSSLNWSSDFFDVGGDSFTLAQLASKMQALGSSLTTAELIHKMLRDMTVRGIASLLHPLQSKSGVPTPQSRSRSSSMAATGLPRPPSTMKADDIDWEAEIS